MSGAALSAHPRARTESSRRGQAETAAPQTGRGATGFEAQLVELEALSLDDLRLRWRNHWSRHAPAHLSRNLLFRLMAYRFQAEAFGDLAQKTARMLERLADAERECGMTADLTQTSARSDPIENRRSRVQESHQADPLVLKPGTLLLREWRGRTETAMVLAQGFGWKGAVYPSLSAVAQAITGTNWNGHRFFGVHGKSGGKPGESEPQRAARLRAPQPARFERRYVEEAAKRVFRGACFGSEF